jgi:hypothetical protein
VLLVCEVPQGVMLMLQSAATRGCALLQRPGTRGQYAWDPASHARLIWTRTPIEPPTGLCALPGVTSDALSPLHAGWGASSGFAIPMAMVGDRLLLVHAAGQGHTSEVR